VGRGAGILRGWAVKREGGKEGGVDYRYLRDPDLGPVVIAHGVVDSVSEGFPPLPDEVLKHLKRIGYHLSLKDAEIL